MVLRKEVVVMICIFFFVASFVSAGVGIKWNQESLLLSEGEDACISYEVYNPWPEESTVEIGLAGELSSILIAQDTNEILVPAETSSSEALPVEFCFSVPKKVYKKDCILGIMCTSVCGDSLEVYEGEVVLSSVPSDSSSGGSATRASVSAPLRVRVQCDDSDRDYTTFYVVLAIISLVAIYFIVRNRSSLIKKKKKKRS